MVLDFASATVSPIALTPNCSYTLTRAFTYTNGTTMTNGRGYDTAVFTGTADGKLTVSTTNTAKAGTYKINVT